MKEADLGTVSDEAEREHELTLSLKLVHIAFHQDETVSEHGPKDLDDLGLFDVVIAVVVQYCLEHCM